MVQTAATWACRLIAIFALGPIAWWLTAGLRAADGSDHVPGILSTTPALGLLRGLCAVLLAGAAGIITARLVSLREGLFNAGVLLTWGAAGAGTVPDVVRIWPEGAAMPRLALEGLVLGLPLVAMVAFMVTAAGKRGGGAGEPEHEVAPGGLREPPLARIVSMPRAVLAELFGVPPRVALLAEPVRVLNVLLAVAVGAAGAVLAAWLVSQNMLKGQAIAAAAAGGIFAGAGLVLLDYRVSPAAALAGVFLVGVLSPLVGQFGHDIVAAGKPLSASVFGGKLLPPARLLPIDWFAGALIGLPMGLSLGSWLGENRYREQAVGA